MPGTVICFLCIFLTVILRWVPLSPSFCTRKPRHREADLLGCHTAVMCRTGLESATQSLSLVEAGWETWVVLGHFFSE